MKFNTAHFTITLAFFLLLITASRSHADNFNNYSPEAINIELEQDAYLYIPENDKQKKALSKNQQAKLAKVYLENYFAPWHVTVQSKNFLINQKKVNLLQTIKDQLNHFSQTGTWGENLIKHDSGWLDSLEQQMHLDSFPNQSTNAIAVRNTYLRQLPTNNPAFYNFAKAGEGYPFDQLQTSSIWVGTPIHIVQQTLDKDWNLVITPDGYGWLPVEDTGLVSMGFMRKWQKSAHIIPLTDNVSVLDKHGRYRFKTHIGMLFPKKKMTKTHYEFLIPVVDNSRQAKLAKALISKNKAVKYPLPANYENMAIQVNQMLGEPYGWGGLYGHRDCSQTLRDYFSVFGIWLPRHSTHQLGFGEEVSLANLADQEKDQYIIDKATPFLTLIGKPGHVMLYIGEKDNKALVFHNKWGLKTTPNEQSEGRIIIGRSAITDLHLGENLENTESLLNYTKIMTVLAESN